MPKSKSNQLMLKKESRMLSDWSKYEKETIAYLLKHKEVR